MIKLDMGSVTIEGEDILLMAEFATLRAFVEEEPEFKKLWKESKVAHKELKRIKNNMKEGK